jgi:hypothetical protein
MKLSIKAELVYSFAEATQTIASLEASHSSDQMVLAESLELQPPAAANHRGRGGRLD